MKLQNKLNQKGLRLTRPRQVVMEVLTAAVSPISPQEIQSRARQSFETIGLVTVYRTLELLTDLDLVRRVHHHDGCHGYVLASPGHTHHLICRRCHKAVEFSGSEDLTAIIRRVQHETGFQINDHLLELYGICPNCQQI